MENNENIPVFPVASWTIRTAESIESILIRFDYLTNMMQNVDRPDVGRNYALTLEQVKALRDALNRAIPVMENFSPPKVDNPPH